MENSFPQLLGQLDFKLKESASIQKFYRANININSRVLDAIVVGGGVVVVVASEQGFGFLLNGGFLLSTPLAVSF